ncbi:hypothetical protein BT96DRAFT_505412 [Gymnopus androsaceus JB14]|uniref:F-box domain-containing protein n=1 Tax=Gymnopus androsaceus JB14 TaxID=1447944 RepID=A0A6A4HZK9_9AGAR|nr:hypothetical protein BT96DRAFT_505412 [Gymnopus androsaceus JB14]
MLLPDSFRPRPLPQLPDEVLMEIFQFATYVHECESILPLDPLIPKRASHNALGPNTPATALRTKCALVLVNHEWRQVAMSLLYRHLVVRSPSRAARILLSLESRFPTPGAASDNPLPTKYGRFTRHLEIYTHFRGSDKIDFLRTLCSIIQNCPNLRIISGSWMYPLPVGFLETLSHMCGSTLQGISWSSTCADFTGLSRFFFAFQTLRVLDISGIILSSQQMHSQTPFSLPSVQDLVLSTRADNLSFATLISMPQLQNLVLRVVEGSSSDQMNTFLEAHSDSLRTVHIQPPLALESGHLKPSHDFHLPFLACPHLETATFHVNHTPTFQHPSLRCVCLQGVRMSEGLEARSTHMFPDNFSNNTNECLTTLLNISLYPCLETVRAVDYLVEADNHVTSMDLFIQWSEKFENRGVDFQDGSGIVWMYTEVLNNDEAPKSEATRLG